MLFPTAALVFIAVWHLFKGRWGWAAGSQCSVRRFRILDAATDRLGQRKPIHDSYRCRFRRGSGRGVRSAAAKRKPSKRHPRILYSHRPPASFFVPTPRLPVSSAKNANRFRYATLKA